MTTPVSLESAMNYQIPPKKAPPKDAFVDCTDRPDIIAACEAGELDAPIGGWYQGRYLVYMHSLRQWRGEPVENSWRDDFWGWGPNRDGQNMLGRLWMEIRAELRAARVHLVTQRGQPHGSRRRCCEECGVMVWPEKRGDKTPEFTDDPVAYASDPRRCSLRMEVKA